MNVKVCGLREPANIAAICSLPIRYTGFIFHPRSARYVGDTFSPLVSALVPPGIERVGVFVDAPSHRVMEMVEVHNLHCVQLHGNETPEYCHQLDTQRLTIIKAFGVDESFDFNVLEPYAGVVDYYLFDTKSPQHGGTGQKFNWEILRPYNNQKPIILSGGITPDDALAIAKLDWLNIHCIDINSRFEISPALKDASLVSRFISALPT